MYTLLWQVQTPLLPFSSPELSPGGRHHQQMPHVNLTLRMSDPNSASLPYLYPLSFGRLSRHSRLQGLGQLSLHLISTIPS